eukprot:gene506-276_t
MHLIRHRFLEIFSLMMTAYCILAVLAASSTVVRNVCYHPEPRFSTITVKAQQPERMKNSRRLPPNPEASVYFLHPEQRRHAAVMEKAKLLMNARLEADRKMEAENAVLQSPGRVELRADQQGGDDPMEEEPETMEPLEPTEPPPPELTLSPAQEKARTQAREQAKEYKLVEANITEDEYRDLAWEPGVRMYNVTAGHNIVGQPYLVRRFDQVRVSISGMINFSPLWDWNTKAIYVAFVARYATPGTPDNEVAFADVVIRAPPSRGSRPDFINELLLRPTSDWSVEEVDMFNEHLQSLRTPHDVPSLLVDPYEKHLYLNDAIKYVVEDYHTGYLSYTNLEIVMRYQVMSYSGYAPLKENVMGGPIVFHVLPWTCHQNQQRSESCVCGETFFHHEREEREAVYGIPYVHLDPSESYATHSWLTYTYTHIHQPKINKQMARTKHPAAKPELPLTKTTAMGMKPDTISSLTWKMQVEREQTVSKAWQERYDPENRKDAFALAALERTIQRDKKRRDDYSNPEKNPELYTILYRQNLDNATSRFRHQQKVQEGKSVLAADESGPSPEEQTSSRGPASSAFASPATYETTSRDTVDHLPPMVRTQSYLVARCNKYTPQERFPTPEPPTATMVVGWNCQDSTLARSNVDLYKPVKPNVLGPYRNAEDADHALLFGYDLQSNACRGEKLGRTWNVWRAASSSADIFFLGEGPRSLALICTDGEELDDNRYMCMYREGKNNRNVVRNNDPPTSLKRSVSHVKSGEGETKYFLSQPHLFLPLISYSLVSRNNFLCIVFVAEDKEEAHLNIYLFIYLLFQLRLTRTDSKPKRITNPITEKIELTANTRQSPERVVYELYRKGHTGQLFFCFCVSQSATIRISITHAFSVDLFIIYLSRVGEYIEYIYLSLYIFRSIFLHIIITTGSLTLPASVCSLIIIIFIIIVPHSHPYTFFFFLFTYIYIYIYIYLVTSHGILTPPARCPHPRAKQIIAFNIFILDYFIQRIMVPPLLRSRYCFTNDDRILVEVENISGRLSFRGRDGAAEAMESTVIFSIRSSHPYSFYYRGIEGIRNGRGPATGTSGSLPSSPDTLPAGGGGAHDPTRSSSCDHNRAPWGLDAGAAGDSLTFSSSTRSSPSVLSPHLSGSRPARFCRPGALLDDEESESRGAVWDYEVIPVETIPNASQRIWRELHSTSTFSLLSARMFPSAADTFAASSSQPDRPTLVTEVIPDGLLAPGECRTLLFDVDDAEALRKQLKFQSHAFPGPAESKVAFYIYYQRLGPEEKCVRKAAEWLQKERQLYRKWQEGFMRRVMALERRKTASTTPFTARSSSVSLRSSGAAPSPKGNASSSAGQLELAAMANTSTDPLAITYNSTADTRRSSWVLPSSLSGEVFSAGKSHEARARERRIIPPALGCAVRWGVLPRPKHHQLHQLVPVEAFTAFYGSQFSSGTDLRRQLAPVLYEDTHSKPVSGSAAGMFAKAVGTSQTSVLYVLSPSVGAGRESGSSLGLPSPSAELPNLPASWMPGQLNATEPSTPSTPEISSAADVSQPPSFMNRIGAGSGLALLEDSTDDSRRTSVGPSFGGGAAGRHQMTTTLDPETVRRLANSTSAPPISDSVFSVSEMEEPGASGVTRQASHSATGSISELSPFATDTPLSRAVTDAALGLRGRAGSSSGPFSTPRSAVSSNTPRNQILMPLGVCRGVLACPPSAGIPSPRPQSAAPAPHPGPEPRPPHEPAQRKATAEAPQSDTGMRSPAAGQCVGRAAALVQQRWPQARELLLETVLPVMRSAAGTAVQVVGSVATSPLTVELLRKSGVPLLVLFMVYFLGLMLWSGMFDAPEMLNELLA